MNFYPRYPADYMSKTLHLTMEQDGAYTRLMDWCYANEKAIPHEQRYAIARAQSRRERASVDAVLEQFFDRITTESGNETASQSCSKTVWENERIMLEMDKDAPRRVAARVNGRKGGRPKKEPPNGNPPGYDEKPNGFPGSPPESETQKAPHTPYPNNTTELKARHTHFASNSASAGVCDLPDASADDPTPNGSHDSTPKPEVLAAVALRNRGLRITPQHPDLIAAVSEGVTVADLGAMADCYADKPAGYVIAACRRQHAENAKPVSTGESHANRSPSRKLSACERTEQRIREERAKRANSAGVARIA